MITEDYVNPKQAQKLKEKGFDGECITAYYTDGKESETDYVYYDSPRNWNEAKYKASRPTHQMVLKWFREVYDIVVTINYDNDPDSLPYERWGFSWYAMPHYEVDIRTFATYEEATSAAIDYVLDNLI